MIRKYTYHFLLTNPDYDKTLTEQTSFNSTFFDNLKVLHFYYFIYFIYRNPPLELWNG